MPATSAFCASCDEATHKVVDDCPTGDRPAIIQLPDKHSSALTLVTSAHLPAQKTHIFLLWALPRSSPELIRQPNSFRLHQPGQEGISTYISIEYLELGVCSPLEILGISKVLIHTDCQSSLVTAGLVVLLH